MVSQEAAAGMRRTGQAVGSERVYGHIVVSFHMPAKAGTAGVCTSKRPPTEVLHHQEQPMLAILYVFPHLVVPDLTTRHTRLPIEVEVR